MSEYEVSASKRTETGKGAMRRMRSTGWIPGVIYGAGKDAESITLHSNDLRKQLENEAFFSHILTVDLAGEKVQVVLKALQRNPANSHVTHVDFLRVSATESITMRVPLHFMNEDSAPGAKAGGIFSHLMNDVEISCLPGDLPEYIEVDVGALQIGDAVHLSELVMPEGVGLTLDVSDPTHDHTVATLHMPQALDLGEDEPVEGAIAEEEGAEVPTIGEEEEASGEQDED
jgi:large subunit ribosomal protein L25